MPEPEPGRYQLLIVGDSLAQPWRRKFTLSVEGLAKDSVLVGDVMLQPKADSPDGISPANFELYVDGLRIQSVQPADSLRWDTRKQTDGEHVLTVLARGNDAVQTIARSRVTVTVRNAVNRTTSTSDRPYSPREVHPKSRSNQHQEVCGLVDGHVW